MNLIDLTPLRQIVLVLVFSLGTSVTLAGPGAHGPNGEHLDGPPTASNAISTAPQMDAQSELFELVARLSVGKLSILIDRFATNEPVLKAEVEVESGALKAKAKLQADLGDYIVDDPAMLKLLSKPGEHAVVVTVMAGDDSDLLDAVLKVGAGQAQAATQAHDHPAHDATHAGTSWRWAAGGLLVLGLGVIAAWRWRQRAAGTAHAETKLGDAA
jgi:hypothetical protein